MGPHMRFCETNPFLFYLLFDGTTSLRETYIICRSICKWVRFPKTNPFSGCFRGVRVSKTRPSPGDAVTLTGNGALIDDAHSRVRRPSGLETTRVRLTATLAVRLVVRAVVDYKPSHGTSLGAVAVAVHSRGKGEGLFLFPEIARGRRWEEQRRHPRNKLLPAAQN